MKNLWNQKKFPLYLETALYLVFFMVTFTHAYAQDSTGIMIEVAKSKHAALSGFADIGQTIIYILTHWVGPVLGACLSLFGIFKIAIRETIPGTIAIFGGGMLMGVAKAFEWIKTLLN
jgi:hypothetical protein